MSNVEDLLALYGVTDITEPELLRRLRALDTLFENMTIEELEREADAGGFELFGLGTHERMHELREAALAALSGMDSHDNVDDYERLRAALDAFPHEVHA